jgi:threonine/homoserine/homoserine lactone efflux protein
LIDRQACLRSMGGLFLCYLGVRTFLAKPANSPLAAQVTSLAGAYVSAVFLTLSNPMTILSFVAIFAGLGMRVGGSTTLSAGLLVTGVFVGSAVWWLILSNLVGFLGARIGHRHLRWVNRLSGLVIGGFGLAALLSLLRGWT